MNAIVICDKALNEVMDQESRQVQYITGTGQVVKTRLPSHEEIQAMHSKLQLDHDALELHGAANPLPYTLEWQRQRENRHNKDYMELVVEPMIEADKRKHEDGTYHYVAMDDLPEVGFPDHIYKVTSSGDLFKFEDGQYLSYNPYADEGKQLSVPRMVIEDDTVHMPTAGKGPLSVIYNVHALRRDLYMKGVMNWTYADMVPQGLIAPRYPLDAQRSLYFRHSHRALAEQIRTQVRRGGELQKEYVDALDRIGVEVWYADNRFGFKDGDFVAVFA